MKPWGLYKVLTEKYHWCEDDARQFADFLEPMLAFDPESRATAEQCLRNPWIVADGDGRPLDAAVSDGDNQPPVADGDDQPDVTDDTDQPAVTDDADQPAVTDDADCHDDNGCRGDDENSDVDK